MPLHHLLRALLGLVFLVAAHWAGARMVELDGLGHRRILKDPSVVATVLAFAEDRPGGA